MDKKGTKERGMPATPKQIQSALVLASKYVAAVAATLKQLNFKEGEPKVEPAQWPDPMGPQLTDSGCIPIEPSTCGQEAVIGRKEPVTLEHLVRALDRANVLVNRVRKVLPAE